MTMVRMYVSHPFVFGDADKADTILEIEADIAKHFGGFTVSQGRGVWIDNAGVRHDDVVDIYDIMADDKTSTLVMNDFVKRFAKAYGQQCIPYAIMGSENRFMNTEGKES